MPISETSSTGSGGVIGFASKFRGSKRLLGPRTGACLIAAALFFSGGAPGDALIPPGGYTPGGNAPGTYRILLAGQLLVAAPGMRDPRFRQTVILMIRHDASGAFGLIVNRPIGKVKLADLYRQFRLKPPPGAVEVSLFYGGPVRPLAGFVVHSIEPGFSPRFKVTAEIGVTPIRRVLRAMARGVKLRRAIFTAGYSGWGAGQLDGEINRGGWYTAPADEDIVLDGKPGTKWPRAKSRRTRTL